MFDKLSFQYPLWMLLLCLLAGVVFAVILYFKDQRFETKPGLRTSVLAILRFVTVVVAGLLLMGPFLKTIEEEQRLPAVAILTDNSLSVGTWLAEDGRESLRGALRSLENELNERFQVESYAFGQNIRMLSLDSLDFSESLTNIDKALQYVDDIYEGSNLGAVILATDGIFNDGKNPAFTSYSFHAPVYAIALGDTTRKRDLMIKNVFYNEIAYLNDLVRIETDIQSFNAQGSFSRVVLEREMNGQFVEVARENLNIDRESFFRTIVFEQELDAPGVVRYRVRALALSTENNLINNSRDVFIDVLDGRQSILLLANAPHPDLSTLKQVLELNRNYEVEISFDHPSTIRLDDRDLVIFHNLPSAKKDIGSMLPTMNDRKIPRVFILGTQTNIARFNQLQQDIEIISTSNATNDVQAIANREFNYFRLDENVMGRTEQYPPLQAVFGEFRVAPNVRTLLRQRIGTVNTDYPLLSFVENSGIKTAYLFGEGIWRWKLFDFLQSNSFEHISGLLDKCIVYTSTVEDKRKFRVSSSQKIYSENEDVVFTAELYNNSYQLVNEPDVFIDITNPQGEKFDFTFTKNAEAYSLNTGRLPPGRYVFASNTSYNGESFTSNGTFNVRAISYELSETEADYNSLFALSQKYGGNVFQWNEIGSLSDAVLQNEELRPVLYQTVISRPLIDHKWLFVLLATLMCAEWFIRRYWGRI